ncbi:MAG: hypothetical protein KAH38_09810 [Candidatus Hydrogenedentes bacterium]|nr:hypothetical protein [Candidatus Hydrogenedentota bacterium]
MIAFSRTKHEAAVIRKVFKGEPEAYRYIVEQYQPMVYAVALAHTGNIYLADKVVVATLKDGFDRLISLTDPKRLGMLLCTIAQGEAEKLLIKIKQNQNKPRNRKEEAPIDMKWVQSELIDPINEELGSFSVQERKGILLYAFCGMTAKNIALVLKIDQKEAAEDLARTRENIEKALLKEVSNALQPEINNKERLVAIMTAVAGPFVAEKAAQESQIGKPPTKITPIVIAASIVVVVAIGGYFGYLALFGGNDGSQVDVAVSSEGDTVPDQASTESSGPDSVEIPVRNNTYTLEGRIVDQRFWKDGIAGLTVEAAGKTSETDNYGEFVIGGVPKGDHLIKVSYDGIVFPNTRRISTEGNNKPITIEVTEDIPTRFKFQARVYDHNTKDIISKFEVTTCKNFPDMMQPYQLNLFREQNNPEGILRDRYLTFGDYTMYVRAHGYAPFSLQFTIDENWDPNQEYEFPLYRSVALEASVYGPNGVSIAEASVMPRVGTLDGIVTGSAEYVHTDSKGNFSLFTLPIGIQSFLILHITHGTGRAIVELEPGRTTKIRIQLPDKGALTGDITVNKKPAKFKEVRRRVSGSGIDVTRNIEYFSPGQYELKTTPEPVTIIGCVGPGDDDKWFERRMELKTEPSMDAPTWLDFNFSSGIGIIEGDVTLHGAPPRSVFVELLYNIGQKDDKERILFELGAVSTFHLENLPLGTGTFKIYTSPRAMSQTDFASAHALMDHSEEDFELTADTSTVRLDIAL